MAILKICNETHYGEIDGVTLDLRHADLPAGEWYAPTLRHRQQDINKPKVLGKPFIWFPWLGVFNETLVREEVEKDMRPRTPTPSKAEIDEARAMAESG